MPWNLLEVSDGVRLASVANKLSLSVSTEQNLRKTKSFSDRALGIVCAKLRRHCMDLPVLRILLIFHNEARSLSQSDHLNSGGRDTDGQRRDSSHWLAKQEAAVKLH